MAICAVDQFVVPYLLVLLFVKDLLYSSITTIKNPNGFSDG
jgi:hypothetical protein